MNNAMVEADDLFFKKSKNTFKIVIMAILVLIGAFMVGKGIVSNSSIQIDDVTTISYTTMKSGESYYFKDAIVLDAYLETKHESVNVSTDRVESVSYEDSYLVGFEDKDGKWVYTDFTVKRDTELGQRFMEYVEDDTLWIGDLVVSGCFKGHVQNNQEKIEYFEETYELYNLLLTGALLNLEFHYDNAETIEEYHANETGNGVALILFGSIIILAGIVGIIVFVGKRKTLVPDGYVKRLQKYAIQYLPTNLSDLSVNREMLATLRTIFPITEENFPLAKKIFDAGTLGDLSIQQFHLKLALSLENWCASFKEKEILKTVDSLAPHHILPAWIVLTFFGTVLNSEQRTSISKYHQRIAANLFYRGFVIPEMEE